MVDAYAAILSGPFATYLLCSKQIGGDVEKHASFVNAAFKAQHAFLEVVAKSKDPGANTVMNLLGPTSQSIQAIQEFREKNRPSPYFNHLSAVSESIPALGWVTVSPAPSPYVKEMNDAGQFYTNRVLKDWKEKDKTHVEWVKAWVQTLSELQAFVKQYHTTGLAWNPRGGQVSGGAPAAGGPPPPPPPPVDLDLSALVVDSSKADHSALFAEINRGNDVTRGLRKVTEDMQTHKNPNLRGGSVVTASSGTSVGGGVKPVVDKPPKFALEGKKWIVEYQKGNSGLVIDQTQMNQVVYMYRCDNSNLVVRGKINSIVMDSCKKSSVVFDDVVASVEFVNCQSMQMQVMGKVPTISIDKTDGCQMFLSKDSLHVEIVSSKSSEMNVMVPNAQGEFSEYPIAEQFRTTVGPRGLHTVPTESLG